MEALHVSRKTLMAVIDLEMRSLAAAEPVKTPTVDTNFVLTRQSFRRLARRRGTGRPRGFFSNLTVEE